MKYRTRTIYTPEQKTQMWDRWEKGDSLAAIARLFDRGHSSVFGQLSPTGGYDHLPEKGLSASYPQQNGKKYPEGW
jgi:hypothetical protein